MLIERGYEGGGVVALLRFFTAVTVLEALLPSALTKAAPVSARGTAWGLYSSAQFIGIFCGGTVGGVAMQHGGAPAVIGFVLLLTALWGGSQAMRRRAVLRSNG